MSDKDERSKDFANKVDPKEQTPERKSVVRIS
jgi:hypothetical protein